LICPLTAIARSFLPFCPKSVPAPYYFSGVFFSLAGSSSIATSEAGVVACFPEEENITLGRSLRCQRAVEGMVLKNLSSPL